MKNTFKIGFLALAISICLANCSKDNSSKNKPSVNTLQKSNKSFSVLGLKDTITPGPTHGGGKSATPALIATPSVVKDTITPGPTHGGGKAATPKLISTPSVVKDTITPGPTHGGGK